jgi:hypothetical protein
LDAALAAVGVEHRLNLVPGLGHNPASPANLTAAVEWPALKLRTP